MNVGLKSKKRLSELLQNGDETKNEKRTLYRSLWLSMPQLPCLQEAIAEYDIIRQVGKGTFSNVYYAVHKQAAEGEGAGSNSSNSQGVAIKLIDKNRVTHSSDVRKVIRNVRRINTEIDLMRSCVHDGICRVLHAFQTDQHIFIVLEYAERDLFHFMSAYPNGLHMQLAQYLNRIIALSIRHLHTRHIAHRDIKPENILVKGDLHENNLLVKLCDFGLSLRPETKCADFVGSPGFFAPEILLETTYDAFAADIWSYGALLLETVCGTPTFESVWLKAYRFLGQHDVFRDLITESVGSLPGIPTLTRDEDLHRLVTGILNLDADKRDTVHTVVMNPWLYLVKESEETGQLEILRLTITDDNVGNPAAASDGDSKVQHCKRRDALPSFAIDAQPNAGHHRPTTSGAGTKPMRSRSRSMNINMFRRQKKLGSLDEYTLPPMTICHLDDSGVVRQVVQAKLSMAFPNHRLVNFADSTHLIHTIMASQENDRESANEIRICIFDENIGEDLQGSDLAKMLVKLGYKGMILCMTANDELKATRLGYDGVLSKQITTQSLKQKLIEAWRAKFGESSLVHVAKLAPDSEEANFINLRAKCLEQMIRTPKKELKRVELLEMKGDLEAVRCSQGLLEIARDLIQKTSAEECIPFLEDSPLFAAIKKELASLQIAESGSRACSN
ncbi:hypothetical protein CTAYLR_006425 [Chrysophaeum taylorii]|uniref:Protein kinase domain-containing protein n=1 Tax=Chrysophaeum taylorii TaxID=2483200 RepID=A0AAD7UAJ2_9STRA|nr:hypothetical protein CTAYLR_006425 [Chrysophaeum taylorii]